MNRIIEASIVSLVEGEQYVVLNDVKRALNLLFTTAGSYEFTDDDDYLNDLILQARSIIEDYTGVALTGMNVCATVCNQDGRIELPYGPFISLTSIKNSNGEGIYDYTLRGKWFKELVDPTLDYVELTYLSGYHKPTENIGENPSPVLPPALKRAWIEQVVFMYKHRGEEESFSICNMAMNTAGPYSRKSFLV